MINKYLAASLLLLAGMQVQAADGINYRFLEVDYVRADPDGGSAIDTGRADFQFEIGANVYLLAEYQTDFDDVDIVDVGVGYYLPVSAQVDVIFEGAYDRVFASGGSDLDGYRIGTGLRANVSSLIELGAQVSWRDFEGNNGNVILETNALFKISDTFGINALFGVDDDGDLNYGAGFRLNF